MSPHAELLKKKRQSLSLQEEMKLFPVRQEKREQIKKTILANNGISKLPYVPSKRQMHWQKKIIDEGMTKKILEDMEAEISDEKMIANIAFGGNLGDYRSFKKRIKQEDMEEELKLIRGGRHELFATEDDMYEFFKEEPAISADENEGKAAHANDHGPIILTLKDRGGSKTSFTPRSMIQDIYNSPTVKNMSLSLTISQLQAELEPEFGIIPKPVLVKIAREINNSIAQWETEIMNKNNNIFEKKMMEPIIRHCKDTAQGDFEKTNNLGEKALKISNKLAPELGKAIGDAIVRSDEGKLNDDCANETIGSVMERTLKTLSKIYEIPVQESAFYCMNIFENILKK